MMVSTCMHPVSVIAASVSQFALPKFVQYLWHRWLGSTHEVYHCSTTSQPRGWNRFVRARISDDSVYTEAVFVARKFGSLLWLLLKTVDGPRMIDSTYDV